MNIKLIGDPTAASQSAEDGHDGRWVGRSRQEAAPMSVREIGQQMLNKVTGSDGDGLLKMAQAADGNGRRRPITELALLVPEFIKIAEKTLDVNKLKGQTVREVLTTLSKRAAAKIVRGGEGAESAGQLPIINDLPFEEVYLRAMAK